MQIQTQENVAADQKLRIWDSNALITQIAWVATQIFSQPVSVDGILPDLSIVMHYLVINRILMQEQLLENIMMPQRTVI